MPGRGAGMGMGGGLGVWFRVYKSTSIALSFLIVRFQVL